MSLSSLFKERLPINRKEVYYTATVLPCIVCADGFAHIHRLWQLLGIEAPQVNAAPESTNIQFLTEYNAKQSIYLDLDRVRFPVEVVSGETPDVLILINGPSPLMVSIEAKMYDTVSTGDLLNQLRLQREKVLEPLKSAIPEARFVQVALLPAGMQISTEVPARLLHWEQIVEKFADVASASYFCGVLDLALKHYNELRNERLVFHANMEAMRSGDDILKGYDDGTKGYDDGTLLFRTMGRAHGSKGADLAQDIASGGWRKHRYELSTRETPPNPNWFPISVFVDLVTATGPATSN